MWFRFILTGIVLAVVLYIQFFVDFKSAVNPDAETTVQTLEQSSQSGTTID